MNAPLDDNPTSNPPATAAGPAAPAGSAPAPAPAQPLWDRGRLGNVHTQGDKATRVRGMFDAIAPTYELINAIFSLGRDRAWRRRAVALANVQPGEAILDIACGTGDLLRAFRCGSPQAGRLIGTDFSHGMLTGAKARNLDGLSWCEADGLRLPFADGSFAVTSCAFGVRNFQDLDTGFCEMCRVLHAGGRAVILEFSRPANRVIRILHEFYSGTIMPIGARLISQDRTGAYRYLPRSVVSFASPEEITHRLTAAGFARVKSTPLTFGVVRIYVATKERA